MVDFVRSCSRNILQELNCASAEVRTSLFLQQLPAPVSKLFAARPEPIVGGTTAGGLLEPSICSLDGKLVSGIKGNSSVDEPELGMQISER